MIFVFCPKMVVASTSVCEIPVAFFRFLSPATLPAGSEKFDPVPRDLWPFVDANRQRDLLKVSRDEG